MALFLLSKDIAVEFAAKDCESLVSFDPDSRKISSLFLHADFVKFPAVQREGKAGHCFPAT